MALINPTSADISQVGDRSTIAWTWALLTSSDTCVALDQAEYEAAAVEFTGTFDSATIILQGAVLSTYATVKDSAAVDISKTAAGWQTVGQQPRYLKPSASSGGGSQSLTITLLVRRKTATLRS